MFCNLCFGFISHVLWLGLTMIKDIILHRDTGRPPLWLPKAEGSVRPTLTTSAGLSHGTIHVPPTAGLGHFTAQEDLYQGELRGGGDGDRMTINGLCCTLAMWQMDPCERGWVRKPHFPWLTLSYRGQQAISPTLVKNKSKSVYMVNFTRSVFKCWCFKYFVTTYDKYYN